MNTGIKGGWISIVAVVLYSRMSNSKRKSNEGISSMSRGDQVY